MEKNWTAAPWVVRLIFLYWLIPSLIIIFSVVALVLVLLSSEMQGAWGIIRDVFGSKFELIPISSSIDMIFNIIWVMAGYYGWRMLRGSRFARTILELFAWMSAIYLFIYLIYPGVEYLELETMPEVLPEISVFWKIVGWLFLSLEATVIVALRRESVREYTNVF